MPGTPVDAFRFDRERNIWINPSHAGFDYSEGAKVELHTLDLLRGAPDVSLFSQALLERITSWPTLYHFSPNRHNLLRHLRLTPDHTVLELGAGCGAITRQLGEIGGEVWAVEGGVNRAAAAAARTRDLPNVRVFCSDFQDFDPGRTFDVVTLIGVLEYSPVFFKGDDPFGDCLRLAHSLLKPDGVLLVAIENQLGLKYFAGSPEDHTGKPFDGVQDRYRAGGVRTVGRAELANVLASSGFQNVEFQYPFPDYKLPTWVFTERAIRTPGFDAGAIVGMITPTHEGRPTALPLDERKTWPVLFRNGLLGELANSFLVLATPSPTGAPWMSPPGLLAAGYVTDRQPHFNQSTTMSVDDAGAIRVVKARLTQSEPPAGAELVHVIAPEAYRKGPQLEQEALAAFRRNDPDAGVALLRKWVDHLLAHGLASRDASDVYASPLLPEFFDCTPPNLILEAGLGGPMTQVDAEWRYLGKLPVRVMALRYLKILVKREDRLLSKHLAGRAEPAIQLAERLGIGFTRSQFDEARELISRLNETIIPQHRGRLPSGKPKRRKSLLSRLLPRRRRHSDRPATSG